VDTLNLLSARERRRFSQDASRVLEEQAGALEIDLAGLVGICETRDPGLISRPSPGMEEEALAFGRSPELINTILADFEACGLVGERDNKLLAYLAMTSRKLERPLCVLTQSSSGSGKSVLQEAVLGFCPPEDLHRHSTLSARSLFYLGADSLRHKVLALEEAEGADSSAYALRTLISSGGLSLKLTTRDGGGFTVRENAVAGPVAVFLTTTDPHLDPETRSRFWVLGMDESAAQTAAILRHQRHAETCPGQAPLPGRIQQRHRAFQRLLRPLAVANPHAPRLRFGTGHLQCRRDQPKYLGLIRAIAFLRQMSKPVLSGPAGLDYIEVDLEDIRLANQLTAAIMGHTLEELSGPGHALLMQLETLPRPGEFSCREVCRHTGWGYNRVHRYLRELLALEYVVAAATRPGAPRLYRLIYRGEGKDGERFALGLCPVEELLTPGTGFAPGLQGQPVADRLAAEGLALKTS
jgi:hypothetical protein